MMYVCCVFRSLRGMFQCRLPAHGFPWSSEGYSQNGGKYPYIVLGGCPSKDLPQAVFFILVCVCGIVKSF